MGNYKEKIYVGNGREVGEYGNIAIGICMEDIAKYAKLSGAKHWVNLIVGKRKSPSENGKTHWVIIDEYDNKKTPQEKEVEKGRKRELDDVYGAPVTSKSELDDDIPIIEDGDDDEIDIKDIPF